MPRLEELCPVPIWPLPPSLALRFIFITLFVTLFYYIIFITLFVCCVHVCVGTLKCQGVCTHHDIQVESEDSLQKLVLAFHHFGS